MKRLSLPISLPKRSGPAHWPFGLGGSGRAPEPTDEATPSPTAEAMVEPGWTPPLDLLRERRRELELEPVSGLLVRQPELLRQGILVGALSLAVSAGLCGLLLLWHQLIKSRMGPLEGYETQAEVLSKQVTGHRAALKRVSDSNSQIVKRLTDVRSSSALLADLQLRIPEGVQLTSVQMLGPDDIKLEGVARDPVGFGRVNAMQLMLRTSPLFQAKGVTLGKVERVPPMELDARGLAPAVAGQPPPKLELPSMVEFQMSGNLTPLEGNRLVMVMEGLRAEGMARRLQLLQREGLLK